MESQVIHGDALEVLRGMADNSVDAVVTDPPYGLAFMGKKWDYDVPTTELWAECLRVLKPGGHLLAFAGTRTQHRMAVRIEDAGFEIRDMIAWVYGSGFPKSLDVSKAIDKRGGSVAEFAKFRDAVKAAMQRNGVTRQRLQDALGNFMLSHYLTDGSQPAVPVLRDYRIIRDTVGLGHDFDEIFNDEAEREVVGQSPWSHQVGVPLPTTYSGQRQSLDITAPATDAAKRWQGWGTALKPSLEPVTVARKPLVGTVAENVLQWGTGAINVDGCRVGTSGGTAKGESIGSKGSGLYEGGLASGACDIVALNAGRWPANLIHDGSDEVVGMFPVTGPSKAAMRGLRGRHDAGDQSNQRIKPYTNTVRGHDDTGSAARFYYVAKASRSERNKGLEGFEVKVPPVESAHSTVCAKCNKQRVNVSGSCTCESPEWVRITQRPTANVHPTVKPVSLMRYLCRLVTPPGGTVLDPFNGSGTTGIACKMEGFNYIGIERELEYVNISRARIAAWEPEPDDPQLDLFA